MDRVCMKPNVCLKPNRGQGNPALRFIFPLAVIIAIAGTAHASVRIGGWSFWANGELARDFQYTGACPVNLKFDWGVVSAAPVTATYSFLRNDGGHSSTPKSIALPGGGRSTPILEEWRLGANTPKFQPYKGWVELDIESPERVSKRIPFTIQCQ